MSNPLNVTIVGGGLGGLAVARALREHHNVTVIERWGGGNEVGAAINLGPTAVEWLEMVGFSAERTGSLKATYAQTFDMAGRPVGMTDMIPFMKNAKGPWTFQHRADLFNELHRLATTPSKGLGISGKPATVRWSTAAVNVDVESGDVTVSDGEVIKSDLVVGADGLKSVVRPLVVGIEAFGMARPSGLSAFRWTIPMETLEKSGLGDYRAMHRNKPVGIFFHLAFDGTNRSIVIYPCRDFKLLNLAAIVPDTMLKGESTESWSADGSREDLMEFFHDFDATSQKLISLASDVKLWQLRDQDPLPTYIKGRAVLIGDAAHAMTPHQGQGCTQAMEDAEALHYLFGLPEVTRENVPDLLKDFDRVRRPRASQIQDHTRQSQDRKNAEQIYKHSLYNWTYPGIKKCLERLDTNQPMIQI